MAPGIDDPFLDDNEPSAAQEGIDVPGSRSAFTDFINFGVYNGNFRIGPPQALSNIDVASSTTGSNFLPGWKFVQASNTTITAKMNNRGPTLGSNLRFTANAGVANNHMSYVTQLIDIGGSQRGDVGNYFRFSARQSRTGAFTLEISTQYYSADGSVSGMPPYDTYGYINVDSSSTSNIDFATSVDPAPVGARYLKIELGARTTALAVAGDTIDIFRIKRERSPTLLRLPDYESTNGLYDVYQSGSNLLWQPSSTTAGTTTTKRILNYQLVALPFQYINMPASAAATDMLLADYTNGRGAAVMAWAGSIVGVSVRTSAVLSAGTLTVRATKNGATAAPSIAITSASTQNNKNTQAPGLSTFVAGDYVGIEFTTNGTYAPTSTDMTAILWLAMNYDGT